MKAAVMTRHGPPGVLQIRDVPKPKFGKDQILVKMHASTVNPLDCKIRSGHLRLLYPFTRIQGFDFAGKIAALDPDIRGFRAHDEVFGFSRRAGAYAEYLVCSKTELWHKPKNLTFEEAAAVPLAGLTALQALQGRIDENDSVLIIGASGGVGTMAVQLAKDSRAKVTAVCSSKNIGYVKKLGADKVIAYDKEEIPREFDIVFDISGKHAADQFSFRKGFISTLPHVGNFLSRLIGRKVHMVMVRPDADGLRTLKEKIEARKITPHVARTFSLDRIVQAHQALEKGTIGKIVVRIQ